MNKPAGTRRLGCVIMEIYANWKPEVIDDMILPA
jgi:hypothetical protein